MRTDEAATKEGRVRAPRNRADCCDIYCEPNETGRVDLRIPPDIVNMLEGAAEQADRTWNAQIAYVVEVCRGQYLPSADDRRSVQDWQALMAEAKMQLHEGDDWIPFSCLFNTAGTQPGGTA